MIDSARIIEIIKTKQEAVMLQKQLDQLLTSIYANKPFEEIAAEELTFEKKEKLFDLIRYYRIDIRDHSHLQTFLQELKTVIQQVPIVALSLAFYPKQELIAAISTWFLAHIKKPFLLDITVNEALLGGTVVAFNGKYFDYSLKKILEDKYAKGEIRLQ